MLATCKKRIHLVKVLAMAFSTSSGVLALQKRSPTTGHNFGRICLAITKNKGPYGSKQAAPVMKADVSLWKLQNGSHSFLQAVVEGDDR